MKSNLTFEERAEEYKNKIRWFGRVIPKDKPVYFSDGSKMYNWYYNFVNKIKKDCVTKENFSEQELSKLQAFAEIDNLLYDLENKKLTLKK